MKPLSIYWAIDPYTDIKKLWTPLAAAVSALQKKTAAKVHPVYFLDAQINDWCKPLVEQQMEPLIAILKNVLTSSTEAIENVHFEAPEVIYSTAETKRDLAREAAVFFQERQADLVALSTHGRQGVKRAIFGSFCEALLWHCQRPLLVVSPHSKAITSLDRILYPTNTSDRSFSLYKRCLELGHDISHATHIDLYSKITAPGETYAKALTTALGGGWMTLNSYDSHQEAAITQRLQAWKTLGQNKGVEVQIHIDGPEGAVGDRILQMSQELGSDLIAMPTFVSRRQAFFVGSRTLDVVRNSPVPVLIQHFEKE